MAFWKKYGTFLALIVGMVMMLGIYHFTCNRSRFAYVKTGVLLQKYAGIEASNKEFEKEARVTQSNIDTLKNRVLVLQDRYKLDQKVYQELSIAEKEYSSYSQKASQDINNRRLELYKKNADLINAYIKRYGQEHSYRYILGATDNGNILYAPDGEDITEEILTGLNKEYSNMKK